VAFWHPCKLSDFRNPPQRLDSFSMKSPYTKIHRQYNSRTNKHTCHISEVHSNFFYVSTTSDFITNCRKHHLSSSHKTTSIIWSTSTLQHTDELIWFGMHFPRVGPGCVLCTRIDPLHFLAGCRGRRLNQGLVVALGFFSRC